MNDDVLEGLLPGNVFDRYDARHDLELAFADYQRTIDNVRVHLSENEKPVSGLAKIALDNAKALLEVRQERARAQEKASIDPITGLLSREAIAGELARDLEQLVDGGLTVYNLDVNNLKAVNDYVDHQEGNNYLLTVGRALRAHASEGFKPGRISGDELLVIPPRTADAELMQRYVDDRVNLAVEAYAEGLRERIPKMNETLEQYPLGVAVGSGIITPELTRESGRRSIEEWMRLSGAEPAMKARKAEMKQGRTYR